VANQAIALQARAPQTDFMGRAIQQNAQMMNMMSQRRASERQAAQAAQEMEFARAEEARKAELHGPGMAKAGFEAMSQQAKLVDQFLDLSIAGMERARNPEDALKIGQYLKQTFNTPELQGIVDQTLSSLPSDPAQFENWRQQTLFQSMDAKDQLSQEFQRQTTGREERIIATPTFAGAPGGGAAVEVPGSRIQAAEGMQYIKDAEGNIYPVPKTAPGSGGFGTPAPGGGSADVVYGFGKFAQPSKPISSMTIGEVQNFQKNELIPATRGKIGAGPDKGTGAVGTYQIVYGTLKDYAPKVLGPNWRDTPFTADVQDRIAKAIYEDVKNGNLKDTWAGLPNNRPGAYSNVPWEQVRGQIAAVESAGGAGAGGRSAGAPAGQPQPIIKGAPKPPTKTTEAERRFGTISQQMRTNLKEAVDIITNSPDAIQPSGLEYAASQIPFYGEEAALFAQSEARQQFDASVLRFLDNVTFVNTGAGTSKTQEANYRRSYIPTYQDTKGSAYRKLKSMIAFAKNVKGAAGALWTPDLDADFNALASAVETLNPSKGKAPPPAGGKPKTPVGKPPAGVPAEEWKYMTPEDRALWPK